MKQGNHIFYFPSIGKSIGWKHAAAKWPEESHQEVTFDMRANKSSNSNI